MHERGLDVHAKHHAKPDEIDPEFLRRQRQQRYDDESDLEEIEKEREHEHEGVDKNQKPDLSSGQIDQQVFHPFVPVDAIEGEREDTRADEDENDEGRKFGGGLYGLTGQAPSEASLEHCQNQSADRAHGATFGRRRHADEDRPEHQKDQSQRRHHDEDDLLGEFRKQPQSQEPAQQRDDEGNRD